MANWSGLEDLVNSDHNNTSFINRDYKTSVLQTLFFFFKVVELEEKSGEEITFLFTYLG